MTSMSPGYVSRRHNKRDDTSRQSAVNLGSLVNSSAEDTGPAMFEDEVTGVTTLYFQSNRLGRADIYASTLQPDETFGAPQLVVELNSTVADQAPAISRDGLEMYLASDRPGGLGRRSGRTALPQSQWIEAARV